jgi:hypothetical protein
LSLFHLPNLAVAVPVVVLLVVITGYQVVVLVVVAAVLQEAIQWRFWLLVDFIHLILVPLVNHTSPHSIMSRTG